MDLDSVGLRTWIGSSMHEIVFAEDFGASELDQD